MNSNLINTSQISIIIPVKDNQQGIDNFLDSFFKTQEDKKMPLEIIIIDNNSLKPISVAERFYTIKNLRISILTCSKKGPAAARNMGAKLAKGDWLLFTDSDCIATPTSITGYEKVSVSAIAYAGMVIPNKKNYLTNYYSYIKILNPLPKLHDSTQPGYIITANCLIKRAAFIKAGGFDENFELAGGEDVDLGIRLSHFGELKYAPDSLMLHEFEYSIKDFYYRFLRYGKGMKRVLEKHKLSLTIKEMLPEVNAIKFMPLKLLMTYAFRKGLS